MDITKFITIFSVLLIVKECELAQKLSVAVYYESLCPDSIRFINQQLKPVWKDLSQHIDLTLIPFGKSYSINGAEFNCQHGPKECIGNKIQSCALRGITDSDAQVDFVHCFMNTFSYNDPGQSCANEVRLNWNSVANCYHSRTGTNLQLQAEVATNSVSPRFVPTIVFNGVFNQQDQDLSLTDFKGVACKHLQGVQECT